MPEKTSVEPVCDDMHERFAPFERGSADRRIETMSTAGLAVKMDKDDMRRTNQQE